MWNLGGRSFGVATWLGWQIESNWADPFLFFIYSMLRPISGVMILVVMYLVVTRQATQTAIFAYIYLGNAFFIYVRGVIVGVSWTVIDDREHYGTLKYLALAPMPLITYVLGRGVAQLITSTLAVAITIGFGILFFGLPLGPAKLDAPLFILSMALGIMSLAFIGLFLAGATLLMARDAWNAGEAVSAALYLFSGAIFPLSVLPAWLRPVGFGLPVTFWLELVRRSLLGTGAAAFPTFASFSNAQLVLILAGMTALYGTAAVFFFLWAENRARRLGLLDQETLS
ncbi:MAG: ABC transporter permease [Chloroflexi bacterium]|nr:ABC transporter permease [Chloroflexota bacterium]